MLSGYASSGIILQQLVQIFMQKKLIFKLGMCSAGNELAVMLHGHGASKENLLLSHARPRDSPISSNKESRGHQVFQDNTLLQALVQMHLPKFRNNIVSTNKNTLTSDLQNRTTGKF